MDFTEDYYKYAKQHDNIPQMFTNEELEMVLKDAEKFAHGCTIYRMEHHLGCENMIVIEEVNNVKEFFDNVYTNKKCNAIGIYRPMGEKVIDFMVKSKYG
jgi:hypothetical protein